MKIHLEGQIDLNVTGVCFHPSNWKYISVIADNKDILIYNLESGLKHNYEPTKLSKHRSNICSIDWSILPKSYYKCFDKFPLSQLLSVGEDRLVVIWILKENNNNIEIFTYIINALQYECYPLSCKFSNILDYYCKFAVSTTSGDVFIFNSKKIPLRDNEKDKEIENKTSLSNNLHSNFIELGNMFKFEQLKIGISELPITCVCWSKDDKFLICGGIENKGLILHVSSSCISDSLSYENCDFVDLELEVISTVDTQNAILSCSISPKNNLFVFTDKDSNVYFTEVNKNLNCTSNILKWEGLPFFNIKFINEKSIVAVGYDCVPVMFTQINGCIWEHAKNLNSSVLPLYLSPAWLNSFDPMKHYEPNTIHKKPIIDVFPKDENALFCIGCDGKYSLWEF